MYINLSKTPLPNTPFVYQVYIAGFGGEVEITPVSDLASTYWRDMDRESLGCHIMTDRCSANVGFDDHEIVPGYVGAKRSLKGPELHQGLTIGVHDASDGEAVWQYAVEDVHNLPLWAAYDPTYFRIADENNYFVAGRTFERMSLCFDLRLTQPFESDLLELHFSWFSGGQILSGVSYDSIQLELAHQCAEVIQPPIAWLIQ